MVNFSHGKSFFWSWSISDGISYSMDTEISPPNPEFWNTWIFEKTFPKGNEGDAGLREGRVEYADWSYPYDNGDSAKVWSECGGWTN